MPISVLPWASASRRLSFTRPVSEMQARIHTHLAEVCASPPTVGTVVREKYYYPGKSGRVPSRWRIGHVRTEPAIDGRKEGRKETFSSPSSSPLPDFCAPTRPKKGETWPWFGRPYINRGGGGGGDRYSSSRRNSGKVNDRT